MEERHPELVISRPGDFSMTRLIWRWQLAHSPLAPVSAARVGRGGPEHTEDQSRSPYHVTTPDPNRPGIIIYPPSPLHCILLARLSALRGELYRSRAVISLHDEPHSSRHAREAGLVVTLVVTREQAAL